MRLGLLLVLLVSMSACEPMSSATDSTTEAKAAFQAYVDAINNGDIESASVMYDVEEGFHWVERGGLQYARGEDAAESLRTLTSNGGVPRMSIDDIHAAHLSKGAALVSAHFDFSVLSDTGEERFSFDGWMTVGMAMRSGGWRIAGGQSGPGVAP